jgi:hypothetical protein
MALRTAQMLMISFDYLLKGVTQQCLIGREMLATKKLSGVYNIVVLSIIASQILQ